MVAITRSPLGAKSRAHSFDRLLEKQERSGALTRKSVTSYIVYHVTVDKRNGHRTISRPLTHSSAVIENQMPEPMIADAHYH